MSGDAEDRSESFKLKQKLLKRAIAEGRGPETILMIQWRSAWIEHQAARDRDAIAEARMNNNVPRGIRMLNRLAEHLGAAVRFSETTAFTHQGTDTVQ